MYLSLNIFISTNILQVTKLIRMRVTELVLGCLCIFVLSLLVKY